MRDTESAAIAAIHTAADERQRWADVLCAGASCQQGHRTCTTQGRCRVRHDDDRDVQMLGAWLIVSILTVAATAAWVLL